MSFSSMIPDIVFYLLGVFGLAGAVILLIELAARRDRGPVGYGPRKRSRHRWIAEANLGAGMVNGDGQAGGSTFHASGHSHSHSHGHDGGHSGGFDGGGGGDGGGGH